MAIGAAEALSAAVFGVTEGKTKCARISWRTRKRFFIMTNSARSNFVSRLRFAARCVTGVTLVVSGNGRGNRERDCSSPGSTVTGSTAALWPCRTSHVLRVIEFDVENLLEPGGEVLQWWVGVVDIRVADDAHRNIRSNKLRQMTAGASLVSGKPGRRGIVASQVT